VTEIIQNNSNDKPSQYPEFFYLKQHFSGHFCKLKSFVRNRQTAKKCSKFPVDSSHQATRYIRRNRAD